MLKGGARPRVAHPLDPFPLEIFRSQPILGVASSTPKARSNGLCRASSLVSSRMSTSFAEKRKATEKARRLAKKAKALAADDGIIAAPVASMPQVASVTLTGSRYN